MDNDLIYKIALTKVPLVGSVIAKSLISYCGGVKEVFTKPLSILKKAPGVGDIVANNIKRFNGFDEIEVDISFLENQNISSSFFLDKEYPYRLKNIADSPIMLYSKGDSIFSQDKIISIVGTRKMTDYGRQFVSQLVEDLVPYNPVIVSGLAYGVDVWSHKQALKHNLKTSAVLAHSLDRIYPSVHTNVARDMVQSGGSLVSEFIKDAKPDRENFPKRNRIVAGLSDVVIVVESDVKGGSLITAELANQYNRDVMALPGSIHNKFSRGCNYLLKNHKANVIEDVSDLIKLMNWDVKPTPQIQPKLLLDLTEDQQKIVEIFRGENEPIAIDILTSKLQIPSSSLAISLLELEINNIITTLPGKRYRLLGR